MFILLKIPNSGELISLKSSFGRSSSGSKKRLDLNKTIHRKTPLGDNSVFVL